MRPCNALQLKMKTGFTLIELLIVVAIIMIITLPIVGFFNTSQETAQRGNQSLNRVGLMRSATALISKDIRSSTGILLTYKNYTTNNSCLILNGDQPIVYFAQNNSLQRLVFNSVKDKTGLVFSLLPDLDALQYKYDSSDITQAKLITVNLTCSQMKFMQKNDFTIVTVVKIRNK
jgi:prepilin-type N-terminal cleavage/methylation domain-containing protein